MLSAGAIVLDGIELAAIVTMLLGVVAVITYLLYRRASLRSQIERIARWPTWTDDEAAIGNIMAHAARTLAARRGVLVWEIVEEPTVNIACWSDGAASITSHAPEGLTPLLAEDLAQKTFMCIGAISRSSITLVHSNNGRLIKHPGLLLPEPVLSMVTGTGLISAPVTTESVNGRIFFTDLGKPNTDLVSLAEIIARNVGASIDQMHATRHLHEIAKREERIRLAQDLHDGLLQSLTGIRFELLAIADSFQQDEGALRARLLGLERALAIEQRELRHFIGGLKPAPASKDAAGSLTARLDALRERLSLEWKTPVSIRVSPDARECSSELANAVPLMVHEAVVNAMKHARATRVNVNVDSGTDRLRIVVSDDGSGFPFKGHYDHRALGESNAVPRSLFDRVTALGGKMSIESSEQGSRIEMVVSL